jgi:hypothetical protein
MSIRGTERLNKKDYIDTRNRRLIPNIQWTLSRCGDGLLCLFRRMGCVSPGIANTPTSTITRRHRFQPVFRSWELPEEHRVVYAYGLSLVLKTQSAYDNQK